MESPSLEPAQESTIQLAVGLALLVIELGLVLAMRPVTFRLQRIHSKMCRPSRQIPAS
jgi:hypothetical protein